MPNALMFGVIRRPGTPGGMDREAGRTPHGQDYHPFFDLLAKIENWLSERSDRVTDAYLAMNTDGLELTVVGKGQRFDSDLNKELADFAVAMVAGGVPLYALLLASGSSLAPPSGSAGPVIHWSSAR